MPKCKECKLDYNFPCYKARIIYRSERRGQEKELVPVKTDIFDPCCPVCGCCLNPTVDEVTK